MKKYVVIVCDKALNRHIVFGPFEGRDASIRFMKAKKQDDDSLIGFNWQVLAIEEN